MINFLLTQRNKKIREFQQQGLIYADIARYFETSPSAIEKILGKEPVRTLEEISHSHKQLEELFEKRALIISKIDYTKSPYELYMNGFYFTPCNNTIAQTIADTHFGPESDNIVYMALFDGCSLWKARNRLDLPDIEEVKIKVTENNIDANAALERGKHHKQTIEMKLYWELYANGFTVPEILVYITNTNESKVNKAIRCAKKCGVKKHASNENVELLLLDGYKDKDIATLLDMSPNTIKKIKDGIEAIPKPKDHNRQEFIYYLHSKMGKTQTEIAELLNLTRGTVISDLNAYLDRNPKKRDGSTKRRRNPSDSTHSADITLKTDEIVKMRIEGYSVAAIVKATQLKEYSVVDFINKQEATPGTPLYEHAQALRNQIQKLKTEGKSISEIAKLLKKPWQSLKRYYY